MVILSRTVRFAVNPPQLGDAATRTGPNGYAGSPPIRGLGRHYELQVTSIGQADATTGYLLNIKDVDKAARDAAIPIIARACHETPTADPASLMPAITGALAASIGSEALRTVRWMLSPYHSVEMSPTDPTVALLRQKFDFSASHRLHTPALSEEENRRLYGKCNNPSGHGHNYQFEPCVAVKVGPRKPGNARPPFSIDDLERIAEDRVIQRFDHRYLNVDTREFGMSEGLIPSVENIARVFYDLMAPAVREASGGSGEAELRSVTVWETDRTSSTYPG
jgi:6-pyruvoyltetrahydropterin/6-carboxytetrahydropterin synthase